MMTSSCPFCAHEQGGRITQPLAICAPHRTQLQARDWIGQMLVDSLDAMSRKRHKATLPPAQAKPLLRQVQAAYADAERLVTTLSDAGQQDAALRLLDALHVARLGFSDMKHDAVWRAQERLADIAGRLAHAMADAHATLAAIPDPTPVVTKPRRPYKPRKATLPPAPVPLPSRRVVRLVWRSFRVEAA